jgi:hypothetical protein
MAASSAQQRIETRMTRQPGLTTQRGARGGIALVADRPLLIVSRPVVRAGARLLVAQYGNPAVRGAR